jgi:hypothetical protein
VAVVVVVTQGKLPLPGSSRSVISPSELKKLSTHESTGGRAACCREKDGEDSEDDEISGERGVSRSTDEPGEAVGQ